MVRLEAACDGKFLSRTKLDACNVCGGNSSCVDCAGVAYGGRVLDACGKCGGDGTGCAERALPRVQGAVIHASLLPKPLIYMPTSSRGSSSSERGAGGFAGSAPAAAGGPLEGEMHASAASGPAWQAEHRLTRPS